MRSLAAVVLILAGCTERLIGDARCEDGAADPGEVCFVSRGEPLAFDFTPLSLRVADFDGADGPDALVLGTDARGVVVSALARNDGTGTLSAPVRLDVTGCSAHPVPGDVDGDGAVDLLVDDCDDSMLVYRARGDGSFAPPQRVQVGGITRTSAILDVDGDGVRDVIALVVDARAQVALAVAHGDGSGSFAGPVVDTLGPADTPGEVVGFSAADVDGDGRADAVLFDGRGTASPLLGRGDGRSFGLAAPWTELPPSLGVALIDLDGDAAPEALAVRHDPDVIEVYAGRPDGMRLRGRTDVADHREQLLASGDVDGDGTLDLVYFHPSRDALEIRLAEDTYAWPAAERVALDDAGVEQLAVADLDGDGAAELVLGTFAAGTLTILRPSP